MFNIKSGIPRKIFNQMKKHAEHAVPNIMKHCIWNRLRKLCIHLTNVEFSGIRTDKIILFVTNMWNIRENI